MHAPYLLLCLALMAVAGTFAQSKDSLAGVWEAVQVTLSAPQAVTIKPGPNLTIFSAKHYSRIDVQTDKPRPVLASPSAATAEQLRETWGPLIAEGGTYALHRESDHSQAGGVQESCQFVPYYRWGSGEAPEERPIGTKEELVLAGGRVRQEGKSGQYQDTNFRIPAFAGCPPLLLRCSSGFSGSFAFVSKE